MIHEDLIPIGVKDETFYGQIRSTCGSKMKIKRRLKDIEIKIFDMLMTFSPLVTDSEPRYIIFGEDTIVNYPEILIKLLTQKNILPKAYNVDINSIEIIQPEETDKKSADIMKEYENIFKDTIDQKSVCTTARHIIDTGNSKPIYCRTGIISIFYESAIDEEIKKNLGLGIIRQSNSSWSSRIVPVSKPDCSLGMCIDYRPLNKVTVKDKYPIPRIDEILNALAGAKIFSTLDATSGYYQIEVEEDDKEKTAFSWKRGHFEFNRMPFGLCNAPATSQRAMERILQEFTNVFVMPYLDDIIIYSKDVESHRDLIIKVLESLKQAGIALNKKKCNYSRQKSKY